MQPQSLILLSNENNSKPSLKCSIALENITLNYLEELRSKMHLKEKLLVKENEQSRMHAELARPLEMHHQSLFLPRNENNSKPTKPSLTCSIALENITLNYLNELTSKMHAKETILVKENEQFWRHAKLARHDMAECNIIEIDETDANSCFAKHSRELYELEIKSKESIKTDENKPIKRKTRSSTKLLQKITD